MLQPKYRNIYLLPLCQKSRRLCWGIHLQLCDCKCSAGICVKTFEGSPPGWQVDVLLEPEEMTTAMPTAVFPSVASAVLPPTPSEAPQRSQRDQQKMQIGSPPTKPFKAFHCFGIKTSVSPWLRSPVWADPCPVHPFGLIWETTTLADL